MSRPPAPGAPWPAVALACAYVLWVPGCGGPERPPRSPLVQPPAFAPEQFPDIPLPLGFIPDPTADQIALVLGDGSLRRLDISLVHRAGGPDPVVIADEMRRGLTAYGWVRQADGAYAKAGERLTVEAGRSDGAATVRVRLQPPPAR
jgi:hypothetical protein